MSARRRKKGTVVGVFETRGAAEHAVAELHKADFTDEQVGLVFRDPSGKMVEAHKTEKTYADEGAVAGVVTGAGVGALVGIGVLAGVIPVVGPVLAVGALGTILLNAAGGAAIAGLAGALIGWGIPEEEATYYEGEVKSGRFLVTVDAGRRAEEARAILHRFGGFDRHGWAAVRADRALRNHAGELPPAPAEPTAEPKPEPAVTVPVAREEVVIARQPANGPAEVVAVAEEVRVPLADEADAGRRKGRSSVRRKK